MEANVDNKSYTGINRPQVIYSLQVTYLSCLLIIFADGVVPVVEWECDLLEEKDPDAAASHKIDLSVVVPAYNEEERLPAMLDQAIEFLDNPKVSSN